MTNGRSSWWATSGSSRMTGLKIPIALSRTPGTVLTFGIGTPASSASRAMASRCVHWRALGTCQARPQARSSAPRATSVMAMSSV